MSLQPQHPFRADGPSKLPIPKLKRRGSSESTSRSESKRRVGTACVSCRGRKVKCDGIRPRCKNCLDNNQPCVYVQDRKDRLKTATNNNQRVIGFLKELQGQVSDELEQQISDVLEEIETDVADASTALARPKSRPSVVYTDTQHGEANVSAEAGSNEELDILDEDLLRDERARAMGFYGKQSEVSWLRRLQRKMEMPEETFRIEGPHGPPGESSEAASQRLEAMEQRQQRRQIPPLPTTSSTFYLDGNDIETEVPVDPFVLPSLDLAEKLLRCYMDTVHDSFPILSKNLFTSQFYHFYTSLGQGVELAVPDKWRAILNMIFAIGARYSHLIEAEWQEDDHDHLIYHSRARMLGLKGPSLVCHPDLEQMQIIALLSHYYLAIGHVNRAWVAIGTPLRFAYALGLHLRNEDKTASAVKKEILGRIWWGLYCFEQLLCTIAGRPSINVDAYCSVPLPLPLGTEQLSEEMVRLTLEQQAARDSSISSDFPPWAPSLQGFSAPSRPLPEPSNAGSFLKNRVLLCRITQKAMVGLYAAGTVAKTWEDAQQTIVGLSEELETWEASLPPDLNFTMENSDKSLHRERLTLTMYYYSTKILVSRPCLCRLDRRIRNQSKTSDRFNKQMGQLCVSTAMAVIQLLPDRIDTVYLFQTTPWWSIVHYLMQALAVVLLEMSYGTVFFPQNGVPILQPVKKVIRWLRAMKEKCETAGRAYTLSLDLVQKMAKKVNVDISDLLEEDAAANTSSPQLRAGAFEQGQPFWTTEHGQGLGIPPESDIGEFSQETPASIGSMFTPWPAHADAAFQSTIDPRETFLDPSHSNTWYGNPFWTAYDEQNPLPTTSGTYYSNPGADEPGFGPQ